MKPFNVVIPARMASTRLPDKPLADIAGKPMVVRVAERALLAKAERVIVATDDARVMAACQAHQVEAVMTRADHASGTDRIAEVADKMAWSDEVIIVNVQGDEPLIDPQLIRATAGLIEGEIMMATAAHPIDRMDEIFNPNVVKVVLDAQGRALYFSRAPIPWDRDAWAKDEKQRPAMPILRHIGLYAFRNTFLKRYAHLPPSPVEKMESLEQLRVLWHGYAIAVHVSAAIPAPGVDTAADLEKVRALFT